MSSCKLGISQTDWSNSRLQDRSQLHGKVLIIEDDTDSLTSLIDLLEDEGLQAFGAKNGLIGLQLVKKQTPDLVISDVNMPEVNGYGVLRALRQDPKTAKIPFILMTGEFTHIERKRGLEMGADYFLAKPVMPQELMRAIAVLMKQRFIQIN